MNKNNNVTITFEKIAPPQEAPFYQNSLDAGVLPCLRIDQHSDSQWRCSECHTMQPKGTLGVWVPDGLCRSDPAWSFMESARANMWNGSHSKWCFKCAPKSTANTDPNTSYNMDFASCVAALFWAGLFIGIVIASLN